MSGRDEDWDTPAERDPKEERPLRIGADPQAEPEGLAVDPYADEMLLEPRHGSTVGWLWMGILVLVVALLLALAVMVARTGLSNLHPPTPTLRVPLSF